MNFNDLNFKEKDTGGIHAIMKFPNGNVLSVVAGSGMYSTPRENHNSPDDFSAFEIAIFGPDGGWATQNFFPNCGDDVMGWQDREEINILISKIQSRK